VVYVQDRKKWGELSNEFLEDDATLLHQKVPSLDVDLPDLRPVVRRQFILVMSQEMQQAMCSLDRIDWRGIKECC
jgi:hypothetical protein